jgi:hypothetical protein
MDMPTTQECAELALEIFKTAMAFNRTPTQAKYTGDKPTFHVMFSGHVNTIDVMVDLDGYGAINGRRLDRLPIKSEDVLMSLSANEFKSSDYCSERLRNALMEMKRIIEEWEEKQ